MHCHQNLTGVLQESKVQAGWFDEKAGIIWHIMLYGENAIIPTLPKRSFFPKLANEAYFRDFATRDRGLYRHLVQVTGSGFFGGTVIALSWA